MQHQQHQGGESADHRARQLGVPRPIDRQFRAGRAQRQGHVTERAKLLLAVGEGATGPLKELGGHPLGFAVHLHRLRLLLPAVLVAAALHADVPSAGPNPAAEPIGGPYAALLSSSVDLGASSEPHVQVTAALRDGRSPSRLENWAHDAGLSVRWRTGDDWAILEGPAPAMGAALGVAVHDYRGPRGQRFYASPNQPAVPPALRVEVDGLGRVLSYTPHHSAGPWPLPTEVPDRGLSPDAVLRAYNAEPLVRSGATGRGSTVVVFAFDGFDQADLDMYSSAYGLPLFTPEVVGGMPVERRGEATMDLQAIHAVAPGAKTVLVNALPTAVGGGAYPKIAALMQDIHRRYPGAIWSLSIAWACDKLITAADLVPVRSALKTAIRSGTTALNASGDLAGLECKGKGGSEWSAPPGPDDIGLDAVASLPEMTAVGGTTLSTDRTGRWLAERAWFDPPLSNGSSGGASALFERPSWQQVAPVGAPPNRRLIPDIAAIADQFTGLKIVFNQQFALGGGTSIAAPIWAGLVALMNDYLIANGSWPIGELNPRLYRIASGAPRPAFQDITAGGNAVWLAGPGYDMVTGLGTPNVDNLAQNLFVDRVDEELDG